MSEIPKSKSCHLARAEQWEEREKEMGGGGEGDGRRRKRRWEEGEKDMGGKRGRWMRKVENREGESIGDGGEEWREEGGE